MDKERGLNFCTNCRKRTEYKSEKVPEKEVIKNKEYTFIFTRYFCQECGEEIFVHGSIDQNIKERDEQYRRIEEIVTAEDIKRLMENYNIGKAPLSLALGFGEVTIARYLEGQIPSKTYSDVIKKAMKSPEYMEKLLNENRKKIKDSAYKKALKGIKDLEEKFDLSDQMFMSIAYIFKQMDEVTPLTLQKMLYFIQGLYVAKFNRYFFSEDCYAWVHGPVYEKVYNLFKEFTYNPIEDSRFILFAGRDEGLSDEERTLIDLAINTFGKYSGKTLEHITHKEEPWINARQGYGQNEPSQEVISKESIKQYFEWVCEQYGELTEENLNKYIEAKLNEKSA